MPTSGNPNSSEKKKPVLCIKTFGCQMNERDSEVIAGLLTMGGYQLVDDDKQADIIIFNTCSVREHAEAKVWSGVGRLLKARKDGPKPVIGIVGCMAQNYKAGIFEKAKGADFVVGPSDIQKIPEVIDTIMRQGSGGRVQGTGKKEQSLFEMKIWETDSECRPEEIYHTGFHNDKDHAFVVISEGCSNFCSYCVVPYVRGQLHHRDHREIIKEIVEALSKGISNFMLLGQNVNSYRSPAQPSVDFIELLRLVNNIKGVRELTFMTSHPKDTSAGFFKAMAGLDKLRKSLHLPVQSGSDKILGLMNRGYTAAHYISLAEAYRKTSPAGALSTDIIVGFPEETEEDFNRTFHLMKKVEFDSAFIFKYSPRPNTRAFTMHDDVPRKDKERRHKILLDFQRGLHQKRRKLAGAAAVMLALQALSSAPSWAMLDIFDHPKEAGARADTQSGRAAKSPLDYANVCFLKQDYEGAAAACQNLVNYKQAQAYRPQILYLMGLSYIKLERYPQARSYLNDIILMKDKKDDLKLEAHLGVGDSYYLEGNYVCALDSYNEALGRLSSGLDGNNRASGVYYRFFQALTKLGRHEEARGYLDKLQKESPLSLEARMITGQENNLPAAAARGEAGRKDGPYSVQVGCFNEKKNADELYNELITKGFDSFIYESGGEGPRYRVKVGRLSSSDEVQALEEKLKRAGFSTKICQ